MPGENPAIDPELVLSHTEWVRSLACSLAGREGEDLAQATWTAALSSPSPPRKNLRSWLYAIARNLHRRQARRQDERRDVEARGARDEALAATDAMVSRAEFQRRVLAEVMTLAEPYRDTVLMRYFEGLSLEAIARRAGIPASTARTRLARALGKLRERLDKEYGGRSLWTALCLLPDSSGTGTTLLKTTVMMLNTKLAITAGLALAAVGILWKAFPGPQVTEPTVAGAPARASEVPDSAPEPGVSEEEPAEAREVLRAPEPEVAVSPARGEPAQTPRTTSAEIWRDAENAIIGMQDGSVTLDELVVLVGHLLDRLDPESARFDQDNSRTFVLLDDPGRGSATLHMHPGRVGEPGEFEVRMSMPSAPGFEYPEDAQDSSLKLSFGVGKDGVTSCSAFSQTSIQWTEDVNRRFLDHGDVNAGGSLRIEKDAALWRPLILRTVESEAGEMAHQLRMEDERNVYAGVLSAGSLQALAPKFRGLRGK